MMGQSIGPVVGGIISQYLGFHAIFWFLFGLGALTLFLILLLLPETLRGIAGNGSIRLKSIHRPFIHYYKQPSDALLDRGSEPTKKITLSGIVAPLKFLFEKDVFITLFFGATVYTVWSMVTSSTTALFQSPFHLNQLQVGLVFLPNGAGCVIGSYITGYLMDYDYGIVENQYRKDMGISDDTPLNKKELVDFPIEKSRMRNIWWIILIFVFATALYGFSLELNTIAIPLVLQFFIAYSATGVFSLNSALVIDLYPGASASATAVNNLMRCSVGAAGVAVVQLIIDAIGAGPTFLLFALITALLSSLLLLEWFFGPRWRLERRERLAKKEEARKLDMEKISFGKQREQN
jgi:MFS family permease